MYNWIHLDLEGQDNRSKRFKSLALKTWNEIVTAIQRLSENLAIKNERMTLEAGDDSPYQLKIRIAFSGSLRVAVVSLHDEHIRIEKGDSGAEITTEELRLYLHDHGHMYILADDRPITTEEAVKRIIQSPRESACSVL